jgi:hypothetical protein
MIVGKVRILPKSGAPERCFTQVGSNLTRKCYTWKGLPGINTLAYYENSLNASIKSFITLALDL